MELPPWPSSTFSSHRRLLLAVGITLITGLLLRAEGCGALSSGLLVLVAWWAWSLAEAWFHALRLSRGERLWSADASGESILREVSRASLARGETGYRLHLLASRVWLKEGDRAQAWQESFLAHLCRLPLWKRLPILIYGHLGPHLPVQAATAWEARLYRFAPEMPSLSHRLASRTLATGVSALEKSAWELFLATLPTAQDDPLLLESMLLGALERIQHADQLGHQDWSPLVPYLFEEVLRLLLRRHGESRVAWDREAPALHLLRQGRLREVIQLAQSLPLSRRSAALCEGEISALRQTGDLRGAQAAIRAALKLYPSSFRLWMERFQAAMAASETGIALDSMERAEGLLPALPERDRPRHEGEWHLRRAEYAHWIQRDPDLAWIHLQALSEASREENGLLVLQVQMALEHYAAAQEGARRLLTRHPQDTELLLLQAECMAGTDAWATLLPFLERLPEETRERSVFWHLKGLAQAHLGSAQEAREDLEIAAHMAPRDLQMTLDAGHAAAEMGDHVRAEHHWRRALQLDPKCEEALIQLADTRHARQDPEGARRLLRECLLHHPDSEGAQSFLTELEAN